MAVARPDFCIAASRLLLLPLLLRLLFVLLLHTGVRTRLLWRRR